MTNERNRFHSICPYFAMFPEAFVRRNLLAWSEREDIVLDPFCGRGTTILESLLNGRRAIGCDINPVAFCLSRAKATLPRLPDVLDRIGSLEDLYARSTCDGDELRDEFFRLCFHEYTLPQLLFLKNSLDWRNSQTDCFVAALVLGCLHGESHRTELCFSNRMPRTISTKPAYSVRWWLEKGCMPPARDVFAILRRVAKYRYDSPPPSIKGRVVEGDARRAHKMLRAYKGRVKLVVTSPPYLDITDYHEDQWLRLWFLGGPRKPLTGQGKDDRHRRTEEYWRFLREAWAGIAPLLSDSAQVIIRIGGTRLSGKDLYTGLLASLNSTGRRFKLAESRQTYIKNGQKRSFQANFHTASIEHDFRFRGLASA
jgi:hypothetical protein